MKGILTTFLVLWYFQVATAQKEAAIWYFGNNAGLDFNSGSPVILEDGALSTVEGCATFADAEGNLLFYTDGRTVWNRDHGIMPNGTELMGHSSSTQSGIIIPAPGNTDRYYIFTSYFQVQGGLHYSEVDMNENLGMGGVTRKNIELRNPVAEKLTAVQHNNGRDVWVIAHDWGNDAYLAYLVTEAGVNPTPVVSNVGFSLEFATEGNDVFKSRGYLKTSPDGTKLAVSHAFVGAEILDFDTTTGKVSSPLILMQSLTSDFYGVEFSPYGNFLYVSILNDDIYQFDLKAVDVVNSKIPLNVPRKMAGGLQMALDGKIYVASFQSLSVIEQPEQLGLSSSFKGNAIDLGSGVSTHGLPPFITSLFQLGIQADNFCFGDVTEFSVKATEPIDSTEWDFGDGHTSSLTGPSHTYETPGDYTLSATVTIGTRIKTETRQITIYNIPEAKDATLVQCDLNSNGTALFDLSQVDVDILGDQNPLQYQVSYFADEMDAVNGQNALFKTEYQNKNLQETIYARVQSRVAGDCYALSQVSLKLLSLPEPDLEATYVVCPDKPDLTLDGGDFDNWLWMNGQGVILATTRIFQITEVGDYSLTVTNGLEGTSCDKAVYFQVNPSVVPEDFTASVNNFADQLVISIAVQGSGDFQYSIDGLHFQERNFFDVLPGKYTVYVRDIGQCRTISKEVVALGYPKFFTPNSDGVNDYWNIMGAEHFPESIVFIFDRYGKLLQQVSPLELGWDGDYQGLSMPSSDYWFRFENEDGSVFKGHFTLKR